MKHLQICMFDSVFYLQQVYWDKLSHVQVAINCQYSVAQMCTSEDMLIHYSGAPFIDDVMRHNMLKTTFALFR